MDKKVNLLWLLICLPALLFSQAPDSSKQAFPKTFYYKRIFVGMNYGVSFPMGPFSGENTAFNNSSFAKRGAAFNYFDFGFRIEKTLGITGYLFNSNNPIEKDALLKNINSLDDTTYLNPDIGEYQLRGLMLGLLISKYGNLYDLDLKFMAGAAKLSVPKMSFDFKQTGSPELETINYSPVSEQSYGVGLGIGLRVHLNQYIDFMSNLNYLIFHNSFSRDITSQSNARKEEFEITHETLNLSFGIAYRFLNDKSVLNAH